MNEERAILLCGHGSRDAAAVRDFQHIADLVRQQCSSSHVAHAFLEFAEPTIPAALEQLYQAGRRQIDAVPIMITAANHVKRDLPAIFQNFVSQHTDAAVRFGRELGLDDQVVAAARDRIGEALRGMAASDSVLAVVGRGASEQTVVDEVHALTGMLCASQGFAAGVTCFCGIAEPDVTAGLEMAARRGFRRVVVFPFLLFTGVLLERVRATIAMAAQQFPEVEFVEAGCLNNHPSIIAAIVERINECRDEIVYE